MSNFTDLDETAAYDRSIGLSEFEVKTSFAALSLLDEYGAYEVHARAVDDSGLYGVPHALAAHIDFDQRQRA